MTKHAREKWAERVREWRASGLTAEAFAEGKDYAASGLRWAASRLKSEESGRSTRRRRAGERSTPRASAPRFLPLRVGSTPVAGEVVVEVDGARIRVHRGVDLALVGDVVRALQGGGR
jgi:transposase